jgi:transposase
MTNYREILRLSKLKINHSQIAASVKCSRQTVISVLQKANQKGITFDDARNLSDRELANAINDGGIERVDYRMPDYEHVHRELGRSGVTLSLLWVEYCDECRQTGQIPYQSTQFYKYYSDFVRETGAKMHIERKPGESMEVDWAGGTVPVMSSDSGEVLEAYVFVSALSYSGYAYVEAFWSMKSEDWIRAHVNAYTYFNGVTRLLVPDNLKTGIKSNTRIETIVNKTYQEMAEHYGTAVLPARVEAPNDKPYAEGAVKGIKTWILAAIRNLSFFSLTCLNEAIWEKLEEYNTKEFQKIEGSRRSKYLEEKDFLLPLPRTPFEQADWNVATVQKNYHVKCGHQYYSVPHMYIGKKVNIRSTRDVVEVYFENMRICSHQRSDAYRDKYITDEEHMPENHRKHGQWSGERFRAWAAKIGPNCNSCIDYFLSSVKVEEQSYKTCNALLHLSSKYTPQRLERACQRVLSFTPRPSYKAVDSVLKSGQDALEAIEKKQEKRKDSVLEHGFIRGAEYYGGDSSGR